MSNGSRMTVFTNGCFDLLHPGHIDFLTRARELGDYLIVGLNSDSSVRAIKGAGRPLIPAVHREAMLRALRAVDEVVVFDDPTPEDLIDRLQPDVLVKGGDWPVDQIVGAAKVLRRGGKVLSLPFRIECSTTSLLERVVDRREARPPAAASSDDAMAAMSLRESIAVKGQLLEEAIAPITQGGRLLVRAFAAGRRALFIGHGASAADAEHIAGELVERLGAPRSPLTAVALAMPAAVAADERSQARHVEAQATAGDVIVAVDTVDSPDVLSALTAGREIGCKTIGLTGMNGKKVAALCDVAVVVPSRSAARIHEAHVTIGHLWCEIVERSLPRTPGR